MPESQDSKLVLLNVCPLPYQRGRENSSAIIMKEIFFNEIL